MTRDRLSFLLIPLAAFLVIFPLLLHGSSCGHDLAFHLLSWQEAAHQFALGTLHPRWAFTSAFGAGEPRFVFYPPFSWTLGGLLALLASALSHATSLRPEQAFAATPVVYTWLALAAAGLAMYRLARRFVPTTVATLAAALYLANPYILFTAFERSAFAELLATALLPLLLAALLPSPAESSAPLSVPALALPLALLWLTNAPAAVIGSYTVAFVIALRLLLAARFPATRAQIPALAVHSTLGSLLAFALAAFYLVPALLQRRFVQIAMAILPGLRPDDNTLFHHTADRVHDAVLHTASNLSLLLLAVTTCAFLFFALLPASRSAKPPASLSILLASLTVAIAILLTPASLPLWHHLPQLAFLQFPWRLLALLAPISALALALAFRSIHIPRALFFVLCLVLPATLAMPSYHYFNQPCDPDDAPQARFTLFHSPTGDEPTDEYTPSTADNDSLKANNPPFRLLPPGTDDDTPPPAAALPGPAPLSLSLDLPTPALLVLNLRDFPTWRVTRNGQLDPDRSHRADGLLTVPLPAGHQVLVLSEPTPLADLVADGVSAASACLTVVLLWQRRQRHSQATASPLA